MQLLSFKKDESSSFGAVIEGRVVDLGRHLPEYDSLKALLAAKALVKALDTAAEVSPDYRLDKVEFLAPISDMEQVLCIFNDALDAPVSVDPKFIRGANRSLRIVQNDTRPVAVGVAVVISADEDGYQPLGYCLVNYLSPAALAMGPWITTPDELPDPPDLELKVAVEDQAGESHLADPTDAALAVAGERSLSTGDMVAIMHFLPELAVGAEQTIEVEAPGLGTLSSPVQSQPD